MEKSVDHMMTSSSRASCGVNSLPSSQGGVIG